MFTIIATSILIGLIFAPLGCLVLWKKYVYFGDGLAHSSMFAGIISVMAGVPVFYSGLISSSIFALTVFRLRMFAGNSAAIGFVANLMISMSLVLAYIAPDQINITKYLVGDIILAGSDDVATLICILIVVVLFFASFYKAIILTVLSKDVAASQGVKVRALELIFLAILAFSVLSTIKIVGALLVTSIIIIPAMTARIIAKSPLAMIGFAILFSLIMNLVGIILSFQFDIAFAPVIILSGGVMYLIVTLIIAIGKKAESKKLNSGWNDKGYA